jgi:hypothetical protein
MRGGSDCVSVRADLPLREGGEGGPENPKCFKPLASEGAVALFLDNGYQLDLERRWRTRALS